MGGKGEEVCVVDVDEATYVGDSDDGCYYDAAQDRDGKWYTTVLVDSDTGSFVSTLVQDDGPFDTHEEAMAAGRCWAENWCVDNGVVLDDAEDEEATP
jgi:hypothetical protein